MSENLDKALTTPGLEAEQTIENQPIRSNSRTTANIVGTGADLQILATNLARLGATLYNDSGVTAKIKLGTGSSGTSYTLQMVTGSYYEVPFGWTGPINGFWASGTIRATEVSF